MKKSILITWWTGYLGKHLIDKMIKEYNIVILSRNPPDYKGEISRYSIEKTEKVFKENKIDYIINCVADYWKWSTNIISNTIEANIVFPIKILELGIKYNVPIFINNGSSLPVWVSNYSLTKENFLKYAKKIIEGKNIQFINLKLEHFYWPNERGEKFIPFLLKKLEKDEAIDLTAGEQKRDFIYIDDLTYIYEKLLSTWLQNKKDNFLEYQVGTWKSYTIRFVVEKLKELMQSKSQLNFWKIPYRDGESMFSQADTSELRKIIDFSPKVDIEEGLKKVVFSYKDN